MPQPQETSIIIRESEFVGNSERIHRAKIGQIVDGKIITKIVVVPEWVIQAIEKERIK